MESSGFNAFNLNKIHKDNLSKYLNFIKLKEKKIIKEIGFYIDDFRSTNIHDTVYNEKDLKEIFEKFTDYFKQNVNEELDYFTNLNAVFVQLLYHTAEENKITLNTEVSQMENMNNIKQMKDLIEMITSPNVNLNSNNSKNKGKLDSISNTQTLIADFEELKENYTLLQSNLDDLNKKNKMLSEENNNLKNTNINLINNDMANMSEQINKLTTTNNNNNINSDNLNNIKKLECELSETKKKLESQIEKYQNLMNDYDKKLSESVQFKQLKKYLNEKNAIVIDLKNKLSNYESSKKN